MITDSPTLKLSLPDGFTGAGPDDWKQVADVTAEAFRDDPVTRWIFGTPNGIRSAFRVLARTLYCKHGISYLADDNAGATMWLPPGVPSDMDIRTQLILTAGVLRHGSKGAIKRAITAGDIMAKHHPKIPHMYLFTIGVAEAGRGKGLGRRLIAPMLAACDDAKLPIYLENSNPTNHGFYASQGFERQTIFAAGPDGPPLEAMLRTPR